jgi:hypothetical protein
MSGAAQGSTNTSKAVVDDTNKNGETLKDQKKPTAALEEDDEFEDFPQEGITRNSDRPYRRIPTDRAMHRLVAGGYRASERKRTFMGRKLG